MSIRYQQGANDDLAPLKSTPLDDDSATAWWGGVSRCAVGVALAACLVATALSTATAESIQRRSGDQTDVPANSLVKSTALDYGELWTNWVAPVRASFFQNLPLGDREEIPAGALKKFTSPDEDYWQNPVFALPAVGGVTPASLYRGLPYFFDSDEVTVVPTVDDDFWQNAVPPVRSTFLCPSPWLFDVQEPAGALYGQPDEDFWLQQQLPPPVVSALYQRLPYPPTLGDPEEIPAGNLYGQAEEEFWQNPSAPVPASLFQKLPLGDPEEIPAATLYGQADEDLWQNPTAPVSATIYRSPLFTDPEEVPAGNLLSAHPDEDYWQNPTAPVPSSLYQRLPLAIDPDVPISPTADEDFWVNAVAPVSASFARLYLPDAEEIPAGNLRGQPDEDFWANPTAPIAASLAWPQQYLFDVQEPAGSLHGEPDEDFWQNPVAAVPPSLYQRLPLGDVEEIPAASLFGQFDEDFWKNHVAPLAAELYRSPLQGDKEEVPGALLRFNSPDEDYWQNPAWPVPGSLYQSLPYFFEHFLDPLDFVSIFQPDEDYWQNPVAPVVDSLYRTPVLRDPEEVPAGSLKKFNSPDEDYWLQPVLPAPVPASLYQRLPYAVSLRDVEEIPAGRLFGQYDEDFWRNHVAPFAATLFQRLPIGDPEEIPLRNQPDEDFWQNPVAPVPATLRWPVPFGFEAPEPAGRLLSSRPDEDYWLNPASPIAASFYQTLPYAFDPAEIAVQSAPPEEVLFLVPPATPREPGSTRVAPEHKPVKQKSAKAPVKQKLEPPKVVRSATVEVKGVRASAHLGEVQASGGSAAVLSGFALHAHLGQVEVVASANAQVFGRDRELESFAEWFVMHGDI